METRTISISELQDAVKHAPKSGTYNTELAGKLYGSQEHFVCSECSLRMVNRGINWPGTLVWLDQVPHGKQLHCVTCSKVSTFQSVGV